MVEKYQKSRGTVDDERNFVFYEYDKAGNITGSFKGRFSKPDNEELIGTWFRPDGTGGISSRYNSILPGKLPRT